MEKPNPYTIPTYTFLFSCFLILCGLAYFKTILSFVGELNVNAGDPVRITMFNNKTMDHFTLDILDEKGNKIYESKNSPQGKFYVQLKALGILPMHRIAVNVVAPVKLIPGGQSLGIMMHSKGVMVVGMSDIVDKTGNRVNPAEEAGIKIGDLILSVNGKKIVNEFQLKNELSLNGYNEKITLELKRGQRVIKLKVKAAICSETNRPRIGLFVRDTASGVGTLSFYHPETGTYGALGHIISDIDTAKGIDLSDGKIAEAHIRAIHRGRKGNPGEKIGMIVEDGSITGTIERNTKYGIFGKIDTLPENPFFKDSIPVAMSHEITKGPAEVYTVIEGTTINKYKIEIQEVFYPWNSSGKGMIIKVTDPELIASSGGIIQGMSGSPIIQNGKIAGVVTHVFINDPQRGYGIPVEWMLKEIGILNDKSQQKAS
ncbi:MAG: SpoIVB peptidase [Bacillota bacterium]